MYKNNPKTNSDDAVKNEQEQNLHEEKIEDKPSDELQINDQQKEINEPKNLDDQTEELNFNAYNYENNAHQWDLGIVEAVKIAIAQFEISLEEFEKFTTSEFLLFVSENLIKFSENGISQELLLSMKRKLYETCEELLVRLSLVKNSKESKLNQCLNRIIELTKESN